MTRFGVVCYCSLILASFVASISGQSCRTSNPDARAWIPATWRTILDSTDYDSLLSSSNPLWIETDVNSDGDTFTQTGGVCERFIFTCPTNFMLDNEDNWVFTQYISYESAREVFYNITYSFGDCRFLTGCQTYVTLYRYGSNSAVSMAARTTTSNYQLLTDSATTSQFGTAGIDAASQVRGVARPSNFNGFYLGIRDTGTCGNVQRVLIYYLVCPARVSGLVIFSEVSVPPQTSANTVYSGSCAPNSHAVTSLEVQINSSTSVCTERASEGARCECDGGYYLLNTTTCEACSPGNYRALTESQNSCNTCPSSTVTSQQAAVICGCLTGYYRKSQEGPAVACTMPPGPVQNLRTVSTTSTTATISWDRPASTGGRTDYYYYIGRSDPQGSATSVIAVNNRLVTTGATVSFIVMSLIPYESYVMTVIVHNGVSDQDSSNVGSRTRTIEARTLEDLPGPPMVTPLCTVVVWQAPANPNGEIQGYNIRFSGGTVTYSSASLNFLVTSEGQRTANAPVEVRAINGAGSGSWSRAVQVCQDSCSLPFNFTATSTSVNLNWVRPGSVSSNDYIIQLSGGGTVKTFTLTDGRSSLTYSVPALTPFTSYVINLRNGQSECSNTAATLEGVPTSVTNFQQFCDAVVWKPPLEIQGNLKGFDLHFQLLDGSVDMLQLGPSELFYITSVNQRNPGVTTRIRAYNRANEGSWTSFYSNGCGVASAENCTLMVMATTKTSISLRWSRPTSASGNDYEVLLGDDTTVQTFNVTSSSSTVEYTIRNLKPFTSYTVNVTKGGSSCAMSIKTSEGVPSNPRDFKQFCNVVTWNTPSDVQGDLMGYELDISSKNEKQEMLQETLFLSPNDSFYQTTTDQRKEDTMIRVRANNTMNKGNWTSYYKIGCQEELSNGVLSSIGDVDVLIIAAITAAICIAIFILVILIVYFSYKYYSKKRSGGQNKNSDKTCTSNEVKLNNIY